MTIPVPGRFSVAILISDGSVSVVREVDRRELENGLVRIGVILEDLDRQLNTIPKPITFRDAIEGVMRYREQRDATPHCRSHLEFRSDCERCRSAREFP